MKPSPSSSGSKASSQSNGSDIIMSNLTRSNSSATRDCPPSQARRRRPSAMADAHIDLEMPSRHVDAFDPSDGGDGQGSTSLINPSNPLHAISRAPTPANGNSSAHSVTSPVGANASLDQGLAVGPDGPIFRDDASFAEDDTLIDVPLLCSYLGAADPSAALKIASDLKQKYKSNSGGTNESTIDTNPLSCEYDSQAKFTLFSSTVGLVQGSQLSNVMKERMLFTKTSEDEESSHAPFWLDIYRPSATDMAVLARVLRIHPLTVEDMTTDEAREKCESYDHYLFLTVKTIIDEDEAGGMPPPSAQTPNTMTSDDSDNHLYNEKEILRHTSKPDQMHMAEDMFYVLLFRQCVVSVRYTPLRHPFQVALRLLSAASRVGPTPGQPSPDNSLKLPQESSTASSATKPLFPPLAPDWIAYALLDDVIDTLRPVIRAVEFDVDAIDDLATILHWSEQADLLVRMRRAGKKVTQLIRLLHFKEELVKSLANRAVTFVDSETVVYLRDILDHIYTLHHALAIAKDTLYNSHNLYLSQLSVRMSQLSNSSNNAMNRLSTVGLLFLPMNFITGLWGMNVNVPGQSAEYSDGVLKGQPKDPYSVWFWCLVGSMIAIVAIAAGYLRRQGML